MSSIFSTRIISYSSMWMANTAFFSICCCCAPEKLDLRLLTLSTSYDVVVVASICPGVLEATATFPPSGWRKADNFMRKSIESIKLKLNTLTSANISFSFILNVISIMDLAAAEETLVLGPGSALFASRSLLSINRVIFPSRFGRVSSRLTSHRTTDVDIEPSTRFWPFSER